MQNTISLGDTEKNTKEYNWQIAINYRPKCSASNFHTPFCCINTEVP